MISIKGFKNNILVTLLTITIIFLIGIIDFKTGVELSFSLFYLIPIVLLSLYSGTSKNTIILVSFIAALCWFFSEFINRDFSVLFFPIWNAFVRLSIFLTIGLTIYYLKIKEYKLIKANTDLKKLNEEKNRMIGVAAHDLKNPIGAIYSLSHLMISDSNNIDEELVEELKIIETLSSNTLVVLGNLLSVSAIESGKIDLNTKTHNYVDFVKQQIVFNQILADKKKIKIFLTTEKETINLNFDNHYLSEVIDNLLSNAIKYSPNNSQVHVNISMNSSNEVLTEIIDNGKGIKEDEQKMLFNYFQRTTTLPTDGESSTGLGLAIAKKIVTLHQGKIGVESTINKGSNFYFSIPNK